MWIQLWAPGAVLQLTLITVNHMPSFKEAKAAKSAGEEEVGLWKTRLKPTQLSRFWTANYLRTATP